jgi:hypothetical protein
MIVDCTFPFLAQNDEKWFIISVKPPANLGAGDTQLALWSVTSANPDPNQGNNNGSSFLFMSPKSDLSVTGQAAPSRIGAQETAELVYTIANAGPSDAALYHFDLSRSGDAVAFVSADMPGCTVASGSVSCTIETPLPVGQSQTIRVTVRGEADGDSEIHGAVPHYSAGDPNTGNNDSYLTISVSDKADLAVTGGSFASSPHIDIPLMTTLTNLGPNAATLSTLNIIIPPGLTLKPGSATGAGAGDPVCNEQGQTLVCVVANLPNGGMMQAHFTVRAANWTTQSYPIQVTAVLDSAQQDPDSGNNSRFITVQIHAPQ